MKVTPDKVLTTNFDQGFISVDWFRPELGSIGTNVPERYREQIMSFLNHFWPFGVRYVSALNAYFTPEFFLPEVMNTQSVWMVRDGLIPLLWFFFRNPKPDLFRGVILVDRNFASFVPEAWRRNAGTWELSSDITPGGDSKLLFAGICKEEFCSLRVLRQLLDRAERKLKNGKLISAEKKVLFVEKMALNQEGNAEDYPWRFFATLAEKIGIERVFPMTWGGFENSTDLVGHAFLEFNEKSLCADSYLTQSALSRGAHLLLQARVPQKGSQFAKLSPYHGVHFMEGISGPSVWDSSHSVVLSARKMFESALRSDANVSFPWPKWCSRWGKAVLEQT